MLKYKIPQIVTLIHFIELQRIFIDFYPIVNLMLRNVMHILG